MQLFEAINKRRSIRKFKNQPVPVEDLKFLVECATKAPSAHNKQKWKFIAVTNKELNDRCSEAVSDKIDQLVRKYNITESVQGWKYYSTFFNTAPAVIYVFHQEARGFLDKAVGDKISREEINRLRVHPGIQSIGGAIENLLLAATVKGYGTCWMTAPNVAAPEIEKILEIEEPWQLAAVIPVGVPAENPQARPRKPLEEIFEVKE